MLRLKRLFRCNIATFFLLLLGLGSLVPSHASAQNEEQKQYRKQIETLRAEGTVNTQLFNALYELGDAYLRIDLDTARILALEAKKTAKTLACDTCLAWSNILMGYYHLLRFEYDTAIAYYHLAVPVFTKYQHLQGLCTSFNGISYAYMSTGPYDSSVKYINEHKRLAEAIHDTLALAMAYYDMGNTLLAQHDLDTVLANFLIARTLFEKAQDLYNLADVNYSIGQIYADMGNSKSSVAHHLEAARYNLQLERIASVQDSYYEIAKLFIDLDQLEKAEMYVAKGVAMKPEPTPLTDARTALATGGLAYAKGNFEEALEAFQTADQLLRHRPNFPTHEVSQYNVAMTYSALGRHEDLIAYYHNVVAPQPQIDSIITCGYYLFLGSAYFQKKSPEYNRALFYLQEGLAMTQRFTLPLDEQMFYEALSQAYQKLQQPEKALTYLRKSTVLKDSLNRESSKKLFANLELEYRTAEKEQQIQLLSKEKAIAEIASAKQAQQRNGLLIGLGLLLILLTAAGIAYGKTVKYNRLLAQEDQRKDALMQEVHHRTNNSLQLISALLTMQGESVADNQLKQVLKDSESRIHSLSTLHQMLQEDAAHIQINMEEYLGNIADFHAAVLPEHVDIKTNFSRILLPAKTAMPLALIANELITNSLKYAFPNAAPGTIYFALNPSENEKEWVMEVSDNGVGMDQSEKDDKTNSSQVGSKLIAILARQIGGTMEFVNTKGTATYIRFTA